ncbi:hypothetical protein SK128_021118 [Halocaridina rubra]|uniref:PCNA-associated factor n=1 Tax=Halocaridina rubra TaxID=373956 RepID=A0AAN9A9P6_HALRR
MVRTKADACATKVSAAKAPRKVLSAGPSRAVAKTPGKERYAGGHSYNPQPVPAWQKGIGNFFKSVPKPQTSHSQEGSSGSNDAVAEDATSLQTQFQKNGVISDDDDD